MRRFVVFLILIAACSKKSEAPPARFTPPPRRVEAPAELPAPHRTVPSVWSVSILTTGGFSGAGKGNVAVRSSCSGALPESVTSAVAAANPHAWERAYKRAQPGGMTDQFYYSLTLMVEETEGQPVRYQSGWQDDSSAMLPADLRALHDAVWSARETIRTECR